MEKQTNRHTKDREKSLFFPNHSTKHKELRDREKPT